MGWVRIRSFHTMVYVEGKNTQFSHNGLRVCGGFNMRVVTNIKLNSWLCSNVIKLHPDTIPVRWEQHWVFPCRQ